ncbi:MAG: DUF429 domain-containing protein [Deltaproteobacteria bacterium]|nr:DUF429 domain-containing protein [Deltaproteobacteria bacterium]
MKRRFTRFVGIDLGGGRGKTTAVAELRLPASGEGVEVVRVATRAARTAWTDDTLAETLLDPGIAHDTTVIAVDAPLTRSACDRCERPVCPGTEACVDPAVVWLRTEGRALVRRVAAETANGIARPTTLTAQARLAPYAHRATDVVMTYGRGLLPLSSLGGVNGAIAARATHLRRRLGSAGYRLHHNLVEVSPSATVAALAGSRAARGYKRDADPWRTRALILEKLTDMVFAPSSRMAREDVLQNDHCFEAVIGAYTAYLWAREGWPIPDGCFADDGWIIAPP